MISANPKVNLEAFGNLTLTLSLAGEGRAEGRCA